MYYSAVNKPLFANSLLCFLYLSSSSLHILWLCLGVRSPEKTTFYAGWGVSHRVGPFLPGGDGVGWGGKGGLNGRGNSPYTHLHFHAPPFSPVIFCSLSSKAEITLFL